MKKLTEHQHQVLVVEWFRMQHPDKIIFAIPNGGHRNKLTAVRLKREGVLAGVPDIMMPVSSSGYFGLFVEMKCDEKGKLSKRQKDVILVLESEGYKVAVCYGFEQAKNEIEGYLNERKN